MKVFATEDFIEQFEEFATSRPSLRDKMRAFLAFRKAHPAGEPYNAKDSMFTGDVLKGFRHVHLWQGKGIVSYKATPSEIILYSITNHDDSDRGRYLLNKKHELVPFESPPWAPSPAQKQMVEDQFFDLAGTDEQFLKDAARGKPSDLLDWLASVIGEPSTPEVFRGIVSAFGGDEKFRDRLKTVRKNFGLAEGMRRWIMLAEGLSGRTP